MSFTLEDTLPQLIGCDTHSCTTQDGERENNHFEIKKLILSIVDCRLNNVTVWFPPLNSAQLKVFFSSDYL